MTEAPGTHNPNILPPNIPVPQDDGAAAHLAGKKLPDLALPATQNAQSAAQVNLSTLKGRTVLYVYPRTGVPGVDLPPGWNDIPGARGCTPQSCAFRDHYAELRTLGVEHLFGLSTQDTDYQREAVARLHLPFAILSDEKLAFARALKLPTFEVVGMTLLKRMALVIDDGVVTKAFYPVFPPDKSAETVRDWLRGSHEGPTRGR
jgi:peroxiredoxin